MKRLPQLIILLAVLLVPSLLMDRALDSAAGSMMQSLKRPVTAALAKARPIDTCGLILPTSVIIDPLSAWLNRLTLAVMAVVLFMLAASESIGARQSTFAFTKPPPVDVLTRNRRYRF